MERDKRKWEKKTEDKKNYKTKKIYETNFS